MLGLSTPCPVLPSTALHGYLPALPSTALHGYLREFPQAPPRAHRERRVQSHSGVGPRCPLRTQLVTWQGKEDLHGGPLARLPLWGCCPTVHTCGAPAGDEDTQSLLPYKTQGGAWHW